MSKNFKYAAILFLIFTSLFFGKCASAQLYHSDGANKDELIRLLFQYGREVYNRGVDPQEASYVFQRILDLDCYHVGAQEFLGKIQEKYPNVSIRVHGCLDSKEQIDVVSAPVAKRPAKKTASSLRQERILSANKLGSTDLDASASEDQPNDEMFHSSTPLYAYSQPIVLDIPLPTGLSESIPEASLAAALQKTHESVEKAQALSMESYSNIYSKGLEKDCEKIRLLNSQLLQEIRDVEAQLTEKDKVIVGMQEQLAVYSQRDSASYASIAKDQKELIRIQQGNIDYLQKELDDVKEQVLVGGRDAEPNLAALRQQIADSELSVKENEMRFETKNREAQLLQKQLGEMQEQLQLVKKILSEKNDIITSLRDELESIKLESGK